MDDRRAGRFADFRRGGLNHRQHLILAQAAMVNGQVTKIDEAAGKITLKHGPIKKLDMNEGMTMVFRVQDPVMLKQVKVGEKVRFDADRINGQITVTKIEKAR
jgi:Cu(I)/Ag(I) efflux system periplasmic protein CusF